MQDAFGLDYPEPEYGNNSLYHSLQPIVYIDVQTHIILLKIFHSLAEIVVGDEHTGNRIYDFIFLEM